MGDEIRFYDLEHGTEEMIKRALVEITVKYKGEVREFILREFVNRLGYRRGR